MPAAVTKVGTASAPTYSRATWLALLDSNSVMTPVDWQEQLPDIITWNIQILGQTRVLELEQAAIARFDNTVNVAFQLLRNGG